MGHADRGHRAERRDAGLGDHGAHGEPAVDRQGLLPLHRAAERCAGARRAVLRRRDERTARVCQRHGGRLVGLRIQRVPHRHHTPAAAGRQHYRGEPEKPRGEQPLVSRRGPLPPRAAADEPRAGHRRLGDIRQNRVDRGRPGHGEGHSAAHRAPAAAGMLGGDGEG